MSSRTAIEVGRDGSQTVFHRTAAGRCWTHPIDDPYMIDALDEPPKLACPVCTPMKRAGRRARTHEEQLERARQKRARARNRRLSAKVADFETPDQGFRTQKTPSRAPDTTPSKEVSDQDFRTQEDRTA